MHPYTCLYLTQRQNEHLFSKQDTRILPVTSQSDYLYHCRWTRFASCHYINGSDKLHANYPTASYRAQLHPSKTRKQLKNSKMYLLLLLKWKTEFLFNHYPQSEGYLHLLQSKDALLYTLERSAIPSVLIYHTVPELQPNLNSKYSIRIKA